jgi:uncharacterized protein YigE (DUF2233 family)
MGLKSNLFRITIAVILLLLIAFFFAFRSNNALEVVHYTVDPSKQELAFYWSDDSLKTLGNFNRLKEFLTTKKKTLLFATNGGMFDLKRSPIGLYIENGIMHQELNTREASGNFYLKPNGVFYLTKNRSAVICATSDFKNEESILFATQSGPMLVHEGKIHDAFKKGSKNLNIRNGVGILPDGKVVFAMSKAEVNLYDFAMYFSELGCKEALYLDGFVSRTYLPSQNWIQTDGDFGVMIAVTEPLP